MSGIDFIVTSTWPSNNELRGTEPCVCVRERETDRGRELATLSTILHEYLSNICKQCDISRCTIILENKFYFRSRLSSYYHRTLRALSPFVHRPHRPSFLKTTERAGAIKLGKTIFKKF